MANKVSNKGPDLHGKNGILSNVIFSWAGQIVVIISGFIMPRLIDRHLGQETLGIWDFAWSLISHFILVQMGVSTSINRYVARFRGQSDGEGLNRAVNSIALVLKVLGAAIFLITLACVWLLPSISGMALVNHMSEAQWVVFLLGCSLAVQVYASVYAGILTGCHRWGIHNAIHAITYLLMLCGMILSIWMGFGLIGIAAVNLSAESLGRFARYISARRVCPELEMHRRHVSWAAAREMMTFGSKTFVVDIANLLLIQTVNVLILVFLGPFTLALYSRPMALIKTVSTFMMKYAYVFVPTASSLHGAAEHAELRRLAISAARGGILFSLPALVFLMADGGFILDCWMGEKYANGGLIAMLAGAHLFSIAHAPLFSILTALNQHGRFAMALAGTAALSVGLTYGVLVSFTGDLRHVVIALGIPWVVVHGLCLPIYACRRLSMRVGEFIRGAWLCPTLCCLPYTIFLFMIRTLETESSFTKIVWSVAGGAIILIVSYWRFALPKAVKLGIEARVRKTLCVS